MNIDMLIQKVTELGNADKRPLFTSMNLSGAYRDGYMSALHDVARMAEECAEVIYPCACKRSPAQEVLATLCGLNKPKEAVEVKGELCKAEETKPYPVTLALGMAFDHLAEHPKNSLTIEMEPGSMHIDLYPQKEDV